MKQKALVFGIGQNFRNYKEKIYRRYEVIGLCDNDESKQGSIIDGHLVGKFADACFRDADVILVTPAQNHSILAELGKYGIDDKIVTMDEFYRADFTDEKLRICVICDGGMGDILIERNFLYYLNRKYHIADSEIDIYLSSAGGVQKDKGAALFLGCKWISHIYASDSVNMDDFCHDDKYDLVMRLCIFPYVRKFYGEKLAALNPSLLEYVTRIQKFWFLNYKNGFCDSPVYFKTVRSLFERFDNKYHNFCDIFGDLGIKDEFLFDLPIQIDENACLESYGLKDQLYITFSTGMNSSFVGRKPTRLWGKEAWNRLAQLIKEHFPKLVIVQIGENSPKDIAVDLCLNGKTDLEQMKVLLKHAALHIDYDGGLVHLRHILCGKASVVLYGPSRSRWHEYDENVSISTNVCECEWKSANWLSECPKGYEYPICMKSISPAMVFESIKALIDFKRV